MIGLAEILSVVQEGAEQSRQDRAELGLTEYDAQHFEFVEAGLDPTAVHQVALMFATKLHDIGEEIGMPDIDRHAAAWASGFLTHAQVAAKAREE